MDVSSSWQTNTARRDLSRADSTCFARGEREGRDCETRQPGAAEKVPGADRLLEDQIERKERCGATGYRVGKLLETDALATQIGVASCSFAGGGLPAWVTPCASAAAARRAAAAASTARKGGVAVSYCFGSGAKQCSPLAGKCQDSTMLRL